MKALLADLNVQGHIDSLALWFETNPWDFYWGELGLEYLHFAEVGLNARSPDSQIWGLYQARGYILITDNRNDDGPDSLERTILRENRADALPVLTISNKKRLQVDRVCAREVLESLFVVLIDIDNRKWVGRICLPEVKST